MYAQIPLEDVACSLDPVFSSAPSAVSDPAPAMDGRSTSPPAVTNAALPAVATSDDSRSVPSANESVSPSPAISSAPSDTRDKIANRESDAVSAVLPAFLESNVATSNVGIDVVAPTQPPPVSPASSSPSSAPEPPGTMCELPDGTKIDLCAVERRLEDAAPILARAMVYHLPGQTFFVSLLALRTQSAPSNVGAPQSPALPHHLLHEDVIAAISARGSSAMTTMEAKSDA
jgi:hypothetical protein